MMGGWMEDLEGWMTNEGTDATNLSLSHPARDRETEGIRGGRLRVGVNSQLSPLAPAREMLSR